MVAEREEETTKLFAKIVKLIIGGNARHVRANPKQTAIIRIGTTTDRQKGVNVG